MISEFHFVHFDRASGRILQLSTSAFTPAAFPNAESVEVAEIVDCPMERPSDIALYRVDLSSVEDGTCRLIRSVPSREG